MEDRTSEETLDFRLGSAGINAGDFYYHHKSPDKLYRIITLALDEGTETPIVIYQAQYGKKLIWSRPLSNFKEYLKELSTLRFIRTNIN